MFTDPWGKVTRTFDVINDLALWIATEYILRKQHHLPIRKNHLAIFGYDTESISIAIKGKPQLIIGRCKVAN